MCLHRVVQRIVQRSVRIVDPAIAKRANVLVSQASPVLLATGISAPTTAVAMECVCLSKIWPKCLMHFPSMRTPSTRGRRTLSPGTKRCLTDVFAIRPGTWVSRRGSARSPSGLAQTAHCGTAPRPITPSRTLTRRTVEAKLRLTQLQWGRWGIFAKWTAPTMV